MTGSLITSIVNGHWKESESKRAAAPAAAGGGARDMLSGGADASSGAPAGPGGSEFSYHFPSRAQTSFGLDTPW